MVALRLNADTAKLFLFLLGKGNFEGGITRLNVTATLALGAVVKQHASTPGDTWCELHSAQGANIYKCHQASADLKSTSFNVVQTKNSYVVNTYQKHELIINGFDMLRQEILFCFFRRFK